MCLRSLGFRVRIPLNCSRRVTSRYPWLVHDSEGPPRIPTRDPECPIRWRCREQTHWKRWPADPENSSVMDCRSTWESKAESAAIRRRWRTGLPGAKHECEPAKCATYAAARTFAPERSNRWPRHRCCDLPDAGLQKRVRSSLDRHSRSRRSRDRRSRHVPRCKNAHRWISLHPGILPEGFDAFAYVAIVNVAAVDFKEIGERGRPVSGILK